MLGAYKRLGVTDCVPLAVEITEPMDAVALMRVHWALQRTDREPVYNFTAVYTLAYDELPKMQATLQGL